MPIIEAMITSIMLSFIMAFFPVQDHAESKNDGKSRNLKGNVKSYKESVFERRYHEDTDDYKGILIKTRGHEIYFDTLGRIIEENIHNIEENRVSRESYVYDEFGYRIKTTSADNYKTLHYQEKFDEKGNQIEAKTYLDNGTLLSTTSKAYNENRKITEEKITYTAEGNEFYNSSLRESRVFTYDSAGNNIEEILYHRGNQLRGKIVYVYDQSANLTEMQMLDPKNELLRKVTYEYNSQGNKIAENDGFFDITHEYDAAGKKTVSRFGERDWISYEYNRDGLLEKEKHYGGAGGWLSDSIAYKYNQANQLIEEHETDLTWGNSEKRLYQYDGQGNRIEKKWIKNIGNDVFEEIWTATYDERGKRLREVLKDRGRTFFEVYQYNEQGQKIETEQYESYMPENPVERRTTYLYNNKDSLILKTEFDKRGGIRRDTIIYDEKGRKTREIGLYDTNKIRISYTYNYNQSGKLIDRSTFNSDGTLQSRETYEYDEKEGLVTENRHNSNDEVYRSFVSKYNADGVRLSREIHRKDGLESRETYTYDDKQYLREENHHNSKGELWEVIQYEYDDIGNMIQKKTKSWGEISELINYEITYYP